ncbi:hypothetical protein PFFVO_04294 [Plasmodium falciparum Vietnam Oak-Knoll (FVO)]|uniref:V-type ATPase, D subunit n=1 Tax=Plasmodium falciparum Vietnam Oak-Knoll (FVO) TaxID=1036723 RepID=A0A024V2N7_PLAFA|nr:hypothetical protein PFFVO_04294 [Plasmodium falciparum Vietnam Oak-Knoll (FVO)]
MTNRRVNALNNIVLPRLDGGINYIIKELDEIEREEFYRLKKIKEKKSDKLKDSNIDTDADGGKKIKHMRKKKKKKKEILFYFYIILPFCNYYNCISKNEHIS